MLNEGGSNRLDAAGVLSIERDVGVFAWIPGVDAMLEISREGTNLTPSDDDEAKCGEGVADVRRNVFTGMVHLLSNARTRCVPSCWPSV